MQVGRGFNWALVTKLAPPKKRQLLLGINAGVYMFGRGLGATRAPFCNDANVYGATFLGISVAGCPIGLEILRLRGRK